jgi:hypothetical protein
VRRFLRWLLGLQSYADDDGFRTLARRLDDVSDDVTHLTRRFNRLQGNITGWLARLQQPDDDRDDDDADVPDWQDIRERGLRGSATD